MAIDFTLTPAQRELQLQSRKFAGEVLAGARYWPRDNVDVGVEVEHAWIDDAGHVTDATDTRTEARVYVRLRK